MEYEIEIEKRAQRQIDGGTLNKQINYMIKRALSFNRRKKWKFYTAPRFKSEKLQEEWLYTTVFKFSYIGNKVSDESTKSHFEYLVHIIKTAGNTSGWYPKNDQPSRISDIVSNTGKQLAEIEIPKTEENYFSHIFDREAQINMVKYSIEVAKETKFEKRLHTVLYGAPACGKTDILLSFKKMLGNDTVLQFDATATTAAGAIKTLMDAAKVPLILIVEEIEKTENKSLQWLLGALDQRAEIRKTNFNVGNIRKDIKLLCLATVNDMAKFNTVMDGALNSRFSSKVYCPRPSKEILQKILTREVTNINGNLNWITPCLDYCMDVERTNDPRRVTTLCLLGRDNWLNGNFAKELEMIKAPST